MANLFPTALNDGTSLVNNRATDDTIPASDHNDLADAQIAAESKLGYGASTPTNQKVLVGGASAGTSSWESIVAALPTIVPGYVLGEDGAGGLEWVSPSAGAGETNTASNVGTAGVGLFKSKVGVNLGFKNIESSDGKVVVTNNVTNDTVDLSVDQSQLTLTSIGGTLSIAKGGTGQTSKTAAYDALSPNTTLGDLEYHNGTNNVRLAGNTTTTRKFLRQSGNGSNSAAPTWDTLVAGDIPSLLASKISDFNTAVQLNKLNQLTAPDAAVDFNTQKITGLADPTAPQDGATKSYVDSIATGLDLKASVRAASTANIASLSACSTSMDGVTLVQNDRVLLKDQSTGSENGIYVVGLVTTGTAPLTRASDANVDAEVTSGMFTFVTEGTVNGNNGFVLTTDDPISLGTTALVFTQFSGAGQITAGSGLTKTGNTLNVGAGTGIQVNADDIQVSPTYAGGTSIASLGTVTVGTWNGTAIGAAYGGTGQTSFTKGDLLAATGASALGKLGVGTNGQVLAADSAQATGLGWATPARALFDAVVHATLGDYTTVAAALAGGARSVFVLNGTYSEGTLSTAWTGSVPIAIYGESMLGTILQLGSSAANSWFKLNIAGSQLSNLTVKEGTVSHSSADSGWLSLEAVDIVFRDVLVQGAASSSYANGAGIWVSSSANGFRMFGGGFKQVNTPGCVRFGFAQDIAFEGITCDANEGAEFIATTNLYRTRIYNSRFTYQDTGGRTASLMEGVANSWERCVFDGNFVNFNTSNTSKVVLNIFGAKEYNVVENNTFILAGGFGTAIRASDSRTDQLAVRNNTVITSATSGAEVFYLAGALDNPQVTDNKIHFIGTPRASYGAINLANAIGGLVDGNSIKGFSHATGNYGIDLSSASDVAVGINEFDSVTTPINNWGTTPKVVKTEKTVNLTDGANIATDASLASHFRVTLGGNRTLDNPTKMYNGQRCTWEIIQDATGSRTLAFGSAFAFGTTIPSPTLTTTASKRDFLEAVYNSTANKWYVVAFNAGY